jgi:transmembrane sensor
MAVNSDRIQYLFTQYTNKTCTREELQELFACIAQPEYRVLLEQLMDKEYEALQPLAAASAIDWEHVYQQVTSADNTSEYSLPKRNRFLWIRMAAAALIVLTAGAVVYWWITSSSKKDPSKNIQVVQQSNQDIQPGGNRAVLTLANGQVIDLDSAQNGVLVEQGNMAVVKNQNGEVVYKVVDEERPAGQHTSAYNMLATPRGGQYQLTLPDGSRVWLNAASSIRYPVAFANDERRVEITGEVYFEIEPVRLRSGQKMPFRVMVLPGGGEVEVLGTKFNVNAYSDEPVIKTTLLEGSVKVVNLQSTAMRLRPGQQAIYFSTKRVDMHINEDADLELAMAWKNGFTLFKSADIKSIMRQVARWYDVEVVYEGTVPDRSFTGGISRSANLSELLRLLQVSKVHFRIEGKKLVVMP